MTDFMVVPDATDVLTLGDGGVAAKTPKTHTVMAVLHCLSF